MNAAVEKVIDQVLAAEKGYVNHPSDRGGPTNFGITQAVARANGYTGDMRYLPLDLAREIYRKRYVVEPQFDKVLAQSELLGLELIDTGVNMGPSRAAAFLQRWLNGFNARGTKYPDMEVDGRIGPVTLAALRSFLAWRGAEGAKVLHGALNASQAMRYLDIAEANPTQEDFLYGWLRARVE